MNNWIGVLPINRIELWIIRLFTIIMIFGCGFGAGLYYSMKRDDLMRGMEYMQKAYTTPGMVERVVVTTKR